jgi:hypothetical protein
MKHHSKATASCSTTASMLFQAWRGLAVSCVLFACILWAAPAHAAQTQKPSPAIAQKPAAPQAPVSLANQPPAAASVQFQNGQLTIQAHNSTLLQILQAVTAQTGMKIQGSPGNDRIFGVYGPGAPRAVLSELLSGFSFNYLLVGTASNGAPQRLILAGGAASMPEPSQPAQSVQPAPPDTMPQPPFGPRPAYQPQPLQRQPEARQEPTRNRPEANVPHAVPSPQQILKELEAMHAKQQGS